MQSFIHSSPARRCAWSVLLPILLAGSGLRAADVAFRVTSPQALAFARYVALHHDRDPFAKPGLVGVFVEGSLPELYKSATMLAIRRQDENEPSQHLILEIAGDGTVAEEVIGRSFTLRQQMDLLPLSSIEITPANYKFHYAGEVKTGGAPAYVYDITPKKNRPGLVAGKLWMDSVTGNEIMLSGHLVNLPAVDGPIYVVRDTQPVDGSFLARVTHLSFAVPRLGRAEVAITETVLDRGIDLRSN